ncbi:MAG: sulfotransferase domain-containing protein [Chloroflexi bacterium]|nr:sulfotransferase domain-containing protein [Chloroflexota bacterium]
MLVLAAGMPRAGSGWHYNLVHDLVVAAGGQDARRVRKQFLLAPILTEVNCNIGALTAKRLLPVMVPVAVGRRFAVKTHAGPKSLALRLIRRGWLKPVYIFRDPRAALLSAYEYGRRGAADGRPNAFSHLETIEEAIAFMQGYVRIWEQWLACPQTLAMRYEDLLADYDAEAARLAVALGLGAARPAAQAVIERYRPGRASRDDKGLHFHKGQAERFRDALTPEQLAACAAAFGPALARMGYEV